MKKPIAVAGSRTVGAPPWPPIPLAGERVDCCRKTHSLSVPAANDVDQIKFVRIGRFWQRETSRVVVVVDPGIGSIRNLTRSGNTHAHTLGQAIRFCELLVFAAIAGAWLHLDFAKKDADVRIRGRA